MQWPTRYQWDYMKFVTKDLLPGRQSRSRMGVCLLFHRVKQETGIKLGPFCELSISPQKFREIIEYVAQNFHPISLTELVRLKLKGQKPSEKTTVVTFDDGYRDNWDTAYPILAEFGVPATIYVTTGFIDRTVEPVEFRLAHFISSRDMVEFSWDGHIYTWELQSLAEREKCYLQVKELAKPLSPNRRQQLLHSICGNNREEFANLENQLFMDWDQLTDLAHSPLITIGAHAHSHSLLTTLSSGELLREIEKSKRLLEDNLGQRVENFSYPYGAFNQQIKHLLRQCGFISGVTTAPMRMTVEEFDPMAIPRFEVRKDALTSAQTLSEFMKRCVYS